MYYSVKPTHILYFQPKKLKITKCNQGRNNCYHLQLDLCSSLIPLLFLRMVPEFLQKRRVISWKASCEFKNRYFQMPMLIAFKQD